MDTPYKFVGRIQGYRNLPRSHAWGSFYVDNKVRAGRKRPLHPGDCPFCGMAAGVDTGQSIGRLSFAGGHYLVVNNRNPIVERQVLLIPVPVMNSLGYLAHRLALTSKDVKLALSLARRGFEGLDYTSPSDAAAAAKLPRPDEPSSIFGLPWACYVNAFPGTGRSVARSEEHT